MTLVSPAKINLFLQVTGKRHDGYHELISLMCALRLSDTIRLSFNADSISLACSDPSVPVDETNLAYKAASLYLKHLDTDQGVHIAIQKRIPVAAGLGGGSSNAAAVLRGMNMHFGCPLSDHRLRAIGLSIGADVPFFIGARPAIARGIGEELETYPDLVPYPVVLIAQEFGISTASVYSNLNLGLTNRKKTITYSVLNHRGFDAKRHLCNDLESAVIDKYPAIASAKPGLPGML